MTTFLDENRIYGSTFLLYGNINDDFYCADATIQKMDQYLVTLLKSRGYEHIVFYGTGGTRGAYCLDSVSARFFFNANQGIPLPSGDETAVPQSEREEPAQPGSGGGSVGNLVRRGKKKRGYNAGELSQCGNAGASQSASAQQPNENQSAPPPRIKYALRKLDAAEFYSQFREKMMDPDSHMAIVFYNVLTDYGSQTTMFLPSLKDDILHNFSQIGDHNLCLIVAPETMQNTNDLQALIRGNGLGAKFLKPASNGSNMECVFNPECCFQIGYPSADEVKNMLHRFAVVGTSKHKRIRFAYHEINQVAERILANASVCAQRQKNPNQRKMRSIAQRLENYIHQHFRGVKRPEITLDVIDDIWDVHVDPQEALKKLRRKGWEKAYAGVQQALRSAKNSIRNANVDADSQEHVSDVGIERYAQRVAVEGGPRPRIPNFVLVGNPGTGKTEIARLIGNILYSEGILKVGHTVEVNREKLTSSYVAGVPKATMAQVDLAEEGVLFIDEAHSLGKKDGGVEHSGTGVEVVQTLNAAITDPSRHFCVILAGYPNQMQEVYDLDPGFRSRFTVEIPLDDYNPDLLYEILLGMIRDAHYTLDPALTTERPDENGQTYIPMKTMVQRIYAERNREKFGNARDMETLRNYAMGFAEDDSVIRQHYFYGGLDGKVTEEFFTPKDLGMTKERILETMNERFVGMQNVKKMLESMALKLERYKEDGKNPDDIPLDPIILVGNPGTGKTTVANLLAQLFYSYGILGSSTPIVRNASDFAKEHAGGAQTVAKEAIKTAQDCKGFLFVDEAHQLCSKNFDGAGALKTFMAPLTDGKHPFMACFGVYPVHKDEFLAIDPGNRSRFERNIITLEDYTPEDLYEIFVRAMKRDNYTADAETLALIKQLMKREYETRTSDTGNARHALNILESMKDCLNHRCHRNHIPYASEEGRRFIAEDIPEHYRKGLSAGDNESRLDELRRMRDEIKNVRVGNTALKEVITDLLDKLVFQLRFPNMSSEIIEPGHYFFKGNAGTGKSTSLDFMGDFFFRMGLIKSPEPKRLSASHLVGQYLGQTGVQTRETLEQNMGRIIMIDEAYALSDTNDHANSYKRDAINEIVAKLDDDTFRKTTCVVFAGYEGDMDGLYRENQGLRSRVKEIAFPDFTQEECVQILQTMLEKKDAPLTKEALQICVDQIKQMRQRPYFSNGRTLREYSRVLVSARNGRMLAATAEEESAPDFAKVQAGDLTSVENLFRLLNL